MMPEVHSRMLILDPECINSWKVNSIEGFVQNESMSYLRSNKDKVKPSLLIDALEYNPDSTMRDLADELVSFKPCFPRALKLITNVAIPDLILKFIRRIASCKTLVDIARMTRGDNVYDKLRTRESYITGIIFESIENIPDEVEVEHEDDPSESSSELLQRLRASSFRLDVEDLLGVTTPDPQEQFDLFEVSGNGCPKCPKIESHEKSMYIWGSVAAKGKTLRDLVSTKGPYPHYLGYVVHSKTVKAKFEKHEQLEIIGDVVAVMKLIGPVYPEDSSVGKLILGLVSQLIEDVPGLMEVLSNKFAGNPVHRVDDPHNRRGGQNNLNINFTSHVTTSSNPMSHSARGGEDYNINYPATFLMMTDEILDDLIKKTDDPDKPFTHDFHYHYHPKEKALVPLPTVVTPTDCDPDQAARIVKILDNIKPLTQRKVKATEYLRSVLPPVLYNVEIEYNDLTPMDQWHSVSFTLGVLNGLWSTQVLRHGTDNCAGEAGGKLTIGASFKIQPYYYLIGLLGTIVVDLEASSSKSRWSKAWEEFSLELKEHILRKSNYSESSFLLMFENQIRRISEMLPNFSPPKTPLMGSNDGHEMIQQALTSIVSSVGSYSKLGNLINKRIIRFNQVQLGGGLFFLRFGFVSLCHWDQYKDNQKFLTSRILSEGCPGFNQSSSTCMWTESEVLEHTCARIFSDPVISKELPINAIRGFIGTDSLIDSLMSDVTVIPPQSQSQAHYSPPPFPELNNFLSTCIDITNEKDITTRRKDIGSNKTTDNLGSINRFKYDMENTRVWVDKLVCPTSSYMKFDDILNMPELVKVCRSFNSVVVSSYGDGMGGVFFYVAARFHSKFLMGRLSTLALAHDFPRQMGCEINFTGLKMCAERLNWREMRKLLELSEKMLRLNGGDIVNPGVTASQEASFDCTSDLEILTLDADLKDLHWGSSGGWFQRVLVEVSSIRKSKNYLVINKVYKEEGELFFRLVTSVNDSYFSSSVVSHLVKPISSNGGSQEYYNVTLVPLLVLDSFVSWLEENFNFLHLPSTDNINSLVQHNIRVSILSKQRYIPFRERAKRVRDWYSLYLTPILGHPETIAAQGLFSFAEGWQLEELSILAAKQEPKSIIRKTVTRPTGRSIMTDAKAFRYAFLLLKGMLPNAKEDVLEFLITKVVVEGGLIFFKGKQLDKKPQKYVLPIFSKPCWNEHLSSSIIGPVSSTFFFRIDPDRILDKTMKLSRREIGECSPPDGSTWVVHPVDIRVIKVPIHQISNGIL